VGVVEVAERIREHSTELTSAERRVAEVVLASPQSVGFGTVADLAQAAGVGAASVVRLATKLGFDGYTDLQGSVQRDLVSQLRPAAERIRESGDDERSHHLAVELANVRSTLEAADDAAVSATVDRLADISRPVMLLAGEATTGVAQQFASKLHQLRPDVHLLGGSDVAVRREIAVASPRSTCVVIDLRRYERWVLDAHRQVVARGIWSVGLTDSMLSPIASRSDATFLVSAGSVSPFDSHVGTLALLNMFVASVSTSLRESAVDRLAAVEQAWSHNGSLIDGT
jgi:DNA-binding MurR/RpiR family transcriptional regulator